MEGGYAGRPVITSVSRERYEVGHTPSREACQQADAKGYRANA